MPSPVAFWTFITGSQVIIYEKTLSTESLKIHCKYQSYKSYEYKLKTAHTSKLWIERKIKRSRFINSICSTLSDHICAINPNCNLFLVTKKRNSEDNIWEIIYLWNQNIGKINGECPAVCCCMLFEGRPAGCLTWCMTPSWCLGQIRPKLCSNLLKSSNNGKLFPLHHCNFEARGEVAYEVPRCGSQTVANKHCAVSRTSTHFGD